MDSGRYFSEVGLASCLKEILDDRVTSVNAAAAPLESSRIGKNDRKVGHANAKDRKDLRLISKGDCAPDCCESGLFCANEHDEKHIPRKGDQANLRPYKRSM
jgi:hypothetical protein